MTMKNMKRGESNMKRGESKNSHPIFCDFWKFLEIMIQNHKIFRGRFRGSFFENVGCMAQFHVVKKCLEM